MKEKQKATRRKNDFYPTPAAAVRVLIANRPELLLPKFVLEPCAGEGDIAKVLLEYWKPSRVVTGDIDPERDVDMIADARTYEASPYGACITNPPFNQAFEIVSNFVERGCPSAFLLRLSFLEPTDKRGAWLEKWKPNHVIVLPRISFTGDGKTDSVTCAWLVWNVGGQEGIRVISKENFRAFG